jgi:hypothetical protein
MFGVPISGAAAGNSLGASISKWLGSGDYEVHQNSLVSRVKASSGIPMMHNNSQSVVVRHKEFLGEIRSSTDFTIQRSYPLNPGRPDTFPWLSRIAGRFQEYAFKGVVFHFVPTSGSISSTQALGTVMMQTSYRTTDAAPVSKIEMLNEFWSSESVPFEPFAHPIECDPKENPFNVHYVRSGDVPNTDTLLAYDLGRTFVATSGQSTDGVAIGDLWVTYEVELKKPLLSSDVTAPAQYNLSSFEPGTAATMFLTRTTSFGTLPVEFASSTNTIIIPDGEVGRFFITISLLSPANIAGPISWIGTPTLTNCEPGDVMGGVQVVGHSFTAATAGTNVSYQFCVFKVNHTGVANILIPTPTLGGSFTSTRVRVCRVDA